MNLVTTLDHRLSSEVLMHGRGIYSVSVAKSLLDRFWPLAVLHAELDVPS